MPDNHRRPMASNRLYNGEVNDFLEAVELHKQACNHEITSPVADDDDDMRRTIESCNKTMRESIDEANRAAFIYNEVMREFRPQITAKLKAAGLDDWATAFETGDYSTMAI